METDISAKRDNSVSRYIVFLRLYGTDVESNRSA